MLVEAAHRILPEVSPSMSAYTAQQLTRRGMDVRTHTTVESVLGGTAVLSDGSRFDTDTIVWTAGVKANPLVVRTDLPLDGDGRVACRPDLRVVGIDNAWSAGDCASVPDLADPTDPQATCAPTAQHAVRQAKRLARNLILALRGDATKPYRHADSGSVGSLGLHKGVAEIYGVKLRGFPAWFLHRTYHVARVPTFNRKVRVVADWTLALVFRREVVSLGQIQQPRRQWESIADQLAGSAVTARREPERAPRSRQ